MKKIAIFGTFAIAMLACIGFTSCSKEVNENPEPETYTVNLGWAGEILDVSYEPLTRATNDDLYGIQVYSLPKSVEPEYDYDWNPYAYGLFDDPNNITISLASGYKYKFVASMVKDGKNRLYKDSSGKYYHPFSATLDNKFYYDDSDQKMLLIGSGDAALIDSDNNLGYRKYIRPNLERFYGRLSNYIPGESNINAMIDMKRASFGAKFVVGGKFAVGGKIEIQMDGAPKMELALTEDADQISDIFTFNVIHTVWANNDYTEDIAVNFKWIRADGTEAPMGTHTITFKRNKTTIVKFNIEKDGNDESIGIEIDESESGAMPDGDEVIITDGQMQ